MGLIKIMNVKLITILIAISTLSSCGVSYRINDYNTNTINENLYDVEVIETSNQLRWKLQTDWDFANNYYWFLQRQNYSFFHNQYYRNRLYRFGWQSPHDYWMNWNWVWHSGYYNYNNWNGWNNYYGWNSWNNWNYGNHPYYRNIYGRSTNYNNVYGRRLHNYRILSNTNREISRQRTTRYNRNNNTIKPINNTPIVNPRINPRPKPTVKPRVNPRPKPVIIKPRTNPNNTRSSNRGIPKHSKRKGNN